MLQGRGFWCPQPRGNRAAHVPGEWHWCTGEVALRLLETRRRDSPDVNSLFIRPEDGRSGEG